MARHAHPRVQLEVPDGWIDETVIAFSSPSRDGYSANVVITHEEIGERFADYVERQIRELERAVKGYRAIARRDTEQGRLIEHAFRTDANVPIRQIQLFVDRSPTVFVASFSQAEHAFEQHRGELERILSSLRFT